MINYIHKEGRRIILYSFLGLLVLNILASLIFPGHRPLHLVLGVLSVILLLSIASFFRNPKRLFETDENTVIAPADGKIVTIEEVVEEEYFKTKRLLVSIFMSVKNVHINRHPISGDVKYVKYHPGKYLVAWHPKSSTENERTSIVIANHEMDLLLRQIAGKIARRIVWYVKEGDHVEQNTELGFIKFGSRVDLYLPLDAKVDVQLNQKVIGGKTIIAEM